MAPKEVVAQTGQLFGCLLEAHLNLSHPLIQLSKAIDWQVIESTFAGHFVSARGRPALPPRLVAGLLYLQHTYDCSDEMVVNTWIENPYWQYFTGQTYLQTQSPIDPSSLTRWRKRIGEAGVETLLQLTIATAHKLSVITPASANKVIVDTTVMPKAIAHPTDSRLLEKSRQHLVKLAKDNNIPLRQNYNRQAPRLAIQAGRYAHAKQFKRMRATIKTLKTRVGRVHREVERQLDQLPESIKPKAQNLLASVARILTQQPKDKNKLYSLHAPETECISKGKARTPYEFGVKVSITTTLKEGLVLGARSMPGNPYDGHTLEEAIEQASILAEQRPKIVIVDKGYRGATLENIQILRSGQRKGVTKALKRMILRRSSIEPTIGHMKMDGRLDRNPLKGELGDALHAVLCGAGHNIRLLLKKLRLFCPPFLSSLLRNILAALKQNQSAYQATF